MVLLLPKQTFDQELSEVDDAKGYKLTPFCKNSMVSKKILFSTFALNQAKPIPFP